MNTRISGRVTRALALTATLSLAVPVAGLATMSDSVLVSQGPHDGHVFIGPSGNKVEMVGPGMSTYRPNLASASAKDRAKAQRVLDGVNAFCRNHTVAGIKSNWQGGSSSSGMSMSGPTHFFNPDDGPSGLRPANPAAALIYEGKLDGVMFNGKPLPRLGSIPRAHSHDMDLPVEMVHVYCTGNLKDAFTPNRMLGIKADLRRLRDTIRPAVMDLRKGQLREVRALVRGYAGDRLAPVAPVGSTPGGPDPVLQAMRTEIRMSLMLITERQLRNVWSLMKSY